MADSVFVPRLKEISPAMQVFLCKCRLAGLQFQVREEFGWFILDGVRELKIEQQPEKYWETARHRSTITIVDTRGMAVSDEYVSPTIKEPLNATDSQ